MLAVGLEGLLKIKRDNGHTTPRERQRRKERWWKKQKQATIKQMNTEKKPWRCQHLKTLLCHVNHIHARSDGVCGHVETWHLLLNCELPGEIFEVRQFVPHGIAVLLSQLPRFCTLHLSTRPTNKWNNGRTMEKHCTYPYTLPWHLWVNSPGTTRPLTLALFFIIQPSSVVFKWAALTLTFQWQIMYTHVFESPGHSPCGRAVDHSPCAMEM